MPVKDYKGLRSEDIDNLRDLYGRNEIEKSRKFSAIKLFVSQFASPLIYILIIAGFISILFSHPTDAIIVFVAVGVNVALGFYQEFKAEKSLEALERVVAVRVDVMRDGKMTKLEMGELLPGDVVHLKMGDKIPADGVVVASSNLSVNEAVLTGESIPVDKKEYEGEKDEIDMADTASKQKVFMGTSVVTGVGRMLVVRIGGDTRVGLIAKRLADTEREKTVLQKRLARFARLVSYIVVGVAGLIFAVGYLRGEELAQMFLVSVAVAVSAIPEGLVVALTAILAVGMQRILKRKGLVRKLLAAEALGSVTVVCSDKTGTLTVGEMSVSGSEGELRELVYAASVSNDMADPLEIAMGKWGEEKIKEFRGVKKWVRKSNLPFSPLLKYGALSVKSGRSSRLYVRGAPEVVMSYCKMGAKEREELRGKFERLSSEGHRLVGFATSSRSKGEDIRAEVEKGGLKWLGILIFDDPVRRSVEDDIEKLANAGVGFKVITGDFAGTAGYVMKKLGVEVDSRIVVGDKFSEMGRKEKVAAVRHGNLFARFNPEQKLEVVRILQGYGEVVAMMGDGVNDAPALKKADVGIVVSSASEVSKETADMVLLDDDFGTVVEAVEEGRGIYSNIRKVVLYLLSDSFSEIILIIGSILIGIPLPLTAAQILWVNLANDGFPALALTMEPLDKNLMEKGPRKADEPLFDGEMRVLIAIISTFTGLYVLGVFWYMLGRGYDVNYARTISFLFMGLSTLVYVFVARSLEKPVWKINIFSNMWLVVGVIVGLFMQIGALYLPALQRAFSTHPPSGLEWSLVAVGCLILVVSIELVKWVYIRRSTSSKAM